MAHLAESSHKAEIDLANGLANQPKNLKMMGLKSLDLTPFFDQPDHVMLGDKRGVALFVHAGAGAWEGHYIFDKDTRGKDAIALARELITQLFTSYDARLIVGEVPESHRAARHLTRALGFTPQGTSVDNLGRPCVIYVMERRRWAALSADS